MSRGNNPVETATEKVIADAHLSFGRTLEEVRDQGFLLAIIPRVDERPGIIVGRHRRLIRQMPLEETTMMTNLLRDGNRGIARSRFRRSSLSTGWSGTL